MWIFMKLYKTKVFCTSLYIVTIICLIPISCYFTALPSDFDIIFNPESEVVHFADVRSGDVSHMTISAWIRILRAPQDFHIFAYIVGDEEYSLSNPCSLKLLSKR